MSARLTGNRKCGKIDNFLAQLLSRNEGFQSYLPKLGKTGSTDYVFWVVVVADNTFFLVEDEE